MNTNQLNETRPNSMLSVDDFENYSIELLLDGDKCPKCKQGVIQLTPLTPPDNGNAIGCNNCKFPQEQGTVHNSKE